MIITILLKKPNDEVMETLEPFIIRKFEDDIDVQFNTDNYIMLVKRLFVEVIDMNSPLSITIMHNEIRSIDIR